MAKNKKITPVRYTSRDFNTIKTDLVDYAKRYYPDTFKDFNEASFGALMLDTVAYVGDILSFYLDYQANESFLDTAFEYDNVIRLARQMGYKYNPSQTSQGVATFYVLIPATTLGRPDTDYCPTLLKGTQVLSDDGINFILAEDVYFDANSDEVVIARVDSSTGEPTYFAIKAYGTIISGEHVTETHTIDSFKKFRKVTLTNENIAEVMSVVDSEGKEYFEVDNLSQDVIYKDFRNRSSNKKDATSILKIVPVPRRFTFVRERDSAYLQFGFGSDSLLTTIAVVDPADSVLKLHG